MQTNKVKWIVAKDFRREKWHELGDNLEGVEVWRVEGGDEGRKLNYYGGVWYYSYLYGRSDSIREKQMMNDA